MPCTCLSLRPRSKISSIRVSFGCLLRSALSLISRGSYATICPVSLTSRPVSGVLSNALFWGPGDVTLEVGCSSLFSAAIPAPLRLVKPPCADMVRVVRQMIGTDGPAPRERGTRSLRIDQAAVVGGSRFFVRRESARLEFAVWQGTKNEARPCILGKWC